MGHLTRRATQLVSYTHTQDTAAQHWEITHNLGDYPVVDVHIVYNGQTQKVLPARVVYLSPMTCRISFTTPQAGYAVVS